MIGYERTKLKKHIPGYAIVPTDNVPWPSTFYYLRWGVSDLRGYLPLPFPGQCQLDDRIPFCAPFVVVLRPGLRAVDCQLSADCQGGKGVSAIGLLYGDAISKVVLPGVLPASVQPRWFARKLSGTVLCERLVRLIYHGGCAGEPLPVHPLPGELVLHSRSISHEKSHLRWYLRANHCDVSSVSLPPPCLVKQHVFIDMIGGILVFEAGYFFAGRWKACRYRVKKL